MSIDNKLSEYYERQKEIYGIYSATSQLHWDSSTYMPKKASEGRGEVLGLLAGIAHEKNTDPKFLGLVDELFETMNEMGKNDQRSITLMKKSLDKQRKLSKTFVQEFEELKTNSEHVWRLAKKNNDYPSFQPYLEKMFVMSKEYAQIVGAGNDPYDVLLDEYEEGANQAYYDSVLLPLKQTIVGLVKAHDGVSPTEIYQDIMVSDKIKAKKFLEGVVEKIGFDFDSGLLGVVEHPFASLIGPNDVRINTNLTMLLSSITSTIHELGHGFYDVHSPKALNRSNLAQGVTLGVHESQSRLLENIIGRSDHFVKWILPQMKAAFPECGGWTVEGLKATLNNVKPSLIRVEADEVSYNLHVLMRYEIEKGLMNGTLSTKDLPEIWNLKMKEYLGVQPTNDSQGCLQDVHWSAGLIGYFPTYMLGNIISGQLWNSFIAAHPTRGNEIEKGDFSSYLDWFNKNIWQYGSTLSPQDLINQATGQELSDTHYRSYLTQKYGK